ncbi:unnamed protein product [Schistosoma curassoni]|uniref:Reverse transcriptase domain-containing protein n=1 Tax=Schistosoma curassoni TaxID=6186 RepID=A0A183KJ04_9TREM|nr:unnamed protein product [Schistosoma curassoni]
MQIKTASVATVYASVGRNIHNGKTNVLKYNTENTNPITLDGQTLEDVECFTYLGSIIDEQGGSDTDVNVSTGKARTTFLQLNNIWNSKQLSVNQYQSHNIQYERQDRNDFIRVLLNRMKDSEDFKLQGWKNGLCKNRTCSDQIATLQIIVEQSVEWISSLFINFLDGEKAFDGVDKRNSLKRLRH